MILYIVETSLHEKTSRLSQDGLGTWALMGVDGLWRQNTSYVLRAMAMPEWLPPSLRNRKGREEEEGDNGMLVLFGSSFPCGATANTTYNSVPGIPPHTQHVISSVLLPSYVDDRKSWNESSKIGVMNQSYSWPR